MPIARIETPSLLEMKVIQLPMNEVKKGPRLTVESIRWSSWIGGPQSCLLQKYLRFRTVVRLYRLRGVVTSQQTGNHVYRKKLWIPRTSVAHDKKGVEATEALYSQLRKCGYLRRKSMLPTMATGFSVNDDDLLPPKRCPSHIFPRVALRLARAGF